jgi:hypothetical protein
VPARGDELPILSSTGGGGVAEQRGTWFAAQGATTRIQDNVISSPVVLTSGLTTNRTYLCPDLLSIRSIGAADGWRGHVVRGFFRLLRIVTGV